MADPTAEDLALDLPALLAVCLDRLRHGWDDLPMFASATKNIAALCRRCLAAEAEVARLRQAIAAHRAQRADDRCIEDDDRLYAALGDGIPCDRRVGDKEAMLANCRRYIERRCEGGGWPSYAELEAEIIRLQGIINGFAARIHAQSELLSKRAEKERAG